MATFFDLFEDGKLDVLALEGNNGAGYKLSAYTNTTQDSDAYFIKVLVLHIPWKAVLWIRIPILIGYGFNEAPYSDPRGVKNGPQKRKKILPSKFHFLKC
jgi:hypothetical protein